MNSAIRNARAGLWEKAVELPEAREADFFGANRRPSGVSSEYLKIITDTSLRTRLIESGIAQGLQSPKGPQKIPSIIRLYPDFDAPGKDAPVRNGRPTETARSAFGLPTVEELDALLARVHELESEVRAEMQAHVNADITRLKRQIGELDGDEFEAAFAALDRALATRRKIAAQVRVEAFTRVDADATFAPRKFLRLLSRDSKG